MTDLSTNISAGTHPLCRYIGHNFHVQESLCDVDDEHALRGTWKNPPGRTSSGRLFASFLAMSTCRASQDASLVKVCNCNACITQVVSKHMEVNNRSVCLGTLRITSGLP